MNLILAHKSAKRFDSFVKDSSLFENMKILKRTDSKARESSQWNITKGSARLNNNIREWREILIHIQHYCVQKKIKNNLNSKQSP